MAVKNFVFTEGWVGSQVAGMKMAFFAIFDQAWTHILATKGPNREFIKQKFNFKSLRDTGAILLPIMWP